MQSLTGAAGGTEEAAVELYDLLRDDWGSASVIHDADPTILRRSWTILQRLGLAAADDAQQRCVAVEPELALRRLMAQCRLVLTTREHDVIDAVWGISSSGPRHGLAEHPEVELVAGARAIAARLAESYRIPEASRIALHTEPVPEYPVDKDVFGELARRGVRMRSVYKHQSELGRAQQQHLEGLSRLGVIVRLDHQPVIDLILIDRRTVLLQTDATRPGQGLAVLRSKVWAHVAELVAEEHWRAAVPCHSEHDPVPSPVVSHAR
jgi:hypothetical protein